MKAYLIALLLGVVTLGPAATLAEARDRDRDERRWDRRHDRREYRHHRRHYRHHPYRIYRDGRYYYRDGGRTYYIYKNRRVYMPPTFVIQF